MANKGKGKSTKKFIKSELQGKIIELTQVQHLSNVMLRRHLGLEPDDRNDKTYTGNEEYIKELQRKLAKAKARRNA